MSDGKKKPDYRIRIRESDSPGDGSAKAVLEMGGADEEFLCRVRREREGDKWCVVYDDIHGSPNYHGLVSGLKFDSALAAATFYRRVCLRMSTELQRRQVPAELERYLDNAAMKLLIRARDVVSDYFEAKRALWSLNELRVRLGLTSSDPEDNCDAGRDRGPGDAIRRLLEYKVQLPSRADLAEGRDGKEMTLLDAWYSLFGKEAGRDLARLLRDAFSNVAPDIVADKYL